MLGMGVDAFRSCSIFSTDEPKVKLPRSGGGWGGGRGCGEWKHPLPAFPEARESGVVVAR
jgi:hypothetical protein